MKWLNFLKNKRGLESKKNYFWIIVFFLIIVLPISLYIGYGKFLKKSSGLETINADYKVPFIKEQPKDTLVADKTLIIHSWETEQGAKVVFVPTESLPMIDIDVSFDAGSARDGQKYGIASLTGSLLDQGTSAMPDYDVDKIATIFEKSGVEYSVSVNKDRVRILLRALANLNNLDEILDLYSNIIAKPSFEDISIDREKDRLIVELEYDKFQPDQIGKKEFYKVIYKDHPYANPTTGTIPTVEKITREDIINFHKKYYVLQNATITIVGGIHRDKAREISNNISNKLALGKKASELPNVALMEKSVKENIFHPSNQSFVLLGQPGISKKDKDFFSLTVGNHILGGSLESRLFEKVRIRKGLTYDIYSYFIPGTKEGPFVAAFHTRSILVKKAISLIRDIMSDFIEKGPTKSELKRAKKNLIGGFPLSLEKSSTILNLVSALSFYDMPLNYYDSYVENIEKITVEEIKSVFKKRIDINKMAQVIVGEEKK